MPNVPGLDKGAEVRVNDTIADLLIDRGLAKLVTGKTRDEIEKELKPKKVTKKDVTISKNK